MGKGGPLAFLNKKVPRPVPRAQQRIPPRMACPDLPGATGSHHPRPTPQTWHPGRVQNLEEVWKREQAAAKEEQKARDLQKQIVEERAREELRSVAEAAGVRQ
jgi:hypothetical protein